MWRKKKKGKPLPQMRAAPPGKYFQGELMTCTKCHRSELSDPLIEKHWTLVGIEDKLMYYCPLCFGNASAEDLERLGALWT